MSKIDQSDPIEELRHLIVGNDSEQLAELKQRIESIESRTRDVAEVLPPAIQKGLKADARLVRSLSEPVSESLKIAIRKEPAEYAEILYPVMAPSIRRAISQAISSLLVTINRTMESTTTLSGIRTRIESAKTGIPYAELALRRSLVYRVEHIYLIDRDSGLLIDEVASSDAQSLDSDAVSAMFSAIQSFVQDSFAADESSRLTDLKVGEHNVWVAHGPRAMLACVIFGDAPESLKAQLYDALDNIRTNYANELVGFDGDSSSFDGLQDYIEPLLQLQLKEESNVKKTRKPVWPWLLGALVLAYFVVQSVSRSIKLDTVEHYFKQTPGIAVTDSFWRNGKIVVEGLQDPDAKPPFAILNSHGIDKELLLLDTIPFRSLENDMELQRFQNELILPKGVSLSIRENRVNVNGEAPIKWLIQNDVRLRQLSEDKRLDISDLSASSDSVYRMLQERFQSESLAKIELTKFVGDEQTLLQVGGMVTDQRLAVLNSMFEQVFWVDVVAHTKAKEAFPKLNTVDKQL